MVDLGTRAPPSKQKPTHVGSDRVYVLGGGSTDPRTLVLPTSSTQRCATAPYPDSSTAECVRDP